MTDEEAVAILAMGPPPDPWADVYAETGVEVSISRQLWREWRLDDE